MLKKFEDQILSTQNSLIFQFLEIDTMFSSIFNHRCKSPRTIRRVFQTPQVPGDGGDLIPGPPWPWGVPQ